MSYPRDVPEVAPWSNALVDLGQEILPFNDNKYKLWVAIGSLILTLGTIISPFAQGILSLPPLIWLGKISFPLYLLHGTFIRSLFAWVLFWGQTLGPSLYDENMQRYPLPSASWVAFSVACLMIPLFLTCHLWIKYIEPFFDRIVVWMEKVMVWKEGDSISDGGQRRGGAMGRLMAILRGIIYVIKNEGFSDQIALDDHERSTLLREMEERPAYQPVSTESTEHVYFDGFESVPIDQSSSRLVEDQR